jgi:LysM repeat protein
MATNGTAPASKPESKPGRPARGKKPFKDETLAKAAGAIIAGGIVWSLFKSVTGRGKRQQVHIQEHTTKEVITEKSDTLSKDVGHVSKELEHKAKGVAHGADHKGIDFKHTFEAAGNKISHFGHKKLDGKTIQVFEGDTLWGIARKYNVSVEALMATNGIQNGDNISAGESLIVPK